ncbi:TRAP transporter small permease subunit [Seohaeicola zhoushanensis]|uniref:TRAP transporter small permease protein n=1 Tax=Seohaeicola zhoushanensis TaxID=1569283 RepID=A0A8J3M618_9RHOB|nr:TRAP transporter small permease subunit [Seohaeicola zhoushanensis]GHF39664.1 tripartite transporter small subunit [Seohaeicola zhoushanensis]
MVRLVTYLNTLLGKAISFAILIGMVIIVYEVIMRYVFNAPTVWVQGYTQRIFGAYFVLLGAYTLIHRGHVRVDLLLNDRFPRWRAFLDVVNYLVLLLWTGALSYQAWSYLEMSWLFNERDDSALGHPIWPIKLALFIGVVLIALQGVAELLDSLRRMIRPDPATATSEESTPA